ncbi:hypothetical protein DL89DRAFT_18005 [Linderina pennispora]|uniref:Uncharacterized protein n=1 Tax=Linderina pennispora TaxID=61395 RepID=A0A1Y1WLR0_9FUNG|nr:uncharacterized protein DL89DRAFT_18005 [Linderina pennispora]ORX74499.1 hypothetical protein DL89DRAFT_18005 [Linderina pennispora]
MRTPWALRWIVELPRAPSLHVPTAGPPELCDVFCSAVLPTRAMRCLLRGQMGYLSARESQQQQQQGHLANGVCVNISSACSEIAPCLECPLSLNRYPRRCRLLSRLRSSRLSMPAPAALWCTRLCCFISVCSLPPPVFRLVLHCAAGAPVLFAVA